MHAPSPPPRYVETCTCAVVHPWHASTYPTTRGCRDLALVEPASRTASDPRCVIDLNIHRCCDPEARGRFLVVGLLAITYDALRPMMKLLLNKARRQTSQASRALGTLMNHAQHAKPVGSGTPGLLTRCRPSIRSTLRFARTTAPSTTSATCFGTTLARASVTPHTVPIHRVLSGSSISHSPRCPPPALMGMYMDDDLRREAVSWLIELASQFGLCQSTLFLAVTLLDKFAAAAEV